MPSGTTVFFFLNWGGEGFSKAPPFCLEDMGTMGFLTRKTEREAKFEGLKQR